MLKKFLRIWLPAILIGGLIFFFSSQPYSKQSLIPILANLDGKEGLKAAFSSISFHYSGKEISIAALGINHFIEFFIRKMAHFSFFFLLGFFTLRALSLTLKSARGSVILSVLFIWIFAGLDEWHQSYTGGRTPLIEDSMLDILGGMLAIIIGTILYHVKR
ncbi:VanZ family protein [Cytobacillus sp. FJAT-53684]|uniref:VanZ family protein n=1 Tax=Cytobacillus mangrovibacter TaxID=3299024 RepID=A0ABW6JX56_9BACI